MEMSENKMCITTQVFVGARNVGLNGVYSEGVVGFARIKLLSGDGSGSTTACDGQPKPTEPIDNVS
jgi:hypothetical protein